MKGPSGRHRFDLRRHWLCPLCHARRHTDGHVVSLHCPRCAAHQPPRETWMQLVEEPPRKATKPLEPPPVPAVETGEAGTPPQPEASAKEDVQPES